MRIHSRVLHAAPYIAMLLMFAGLFYGFGLFVFSWIWVICAVLAALHIGTRTIQAKEDALIASTWFGKQEIPYASIRNVHLFPYAYRASSTQYVVLEGEDGSLLELNMWWYRWEDVSRLLLHVQPLIPDALWNPDALELASTGKSPLEKEGHQRWAKDTLYRIGIASVVVMSLGIGYYVLSVPCMT